MNWIHLTQDRALLNCVMNLQFPQNFGNFFPSLATIVFSRRTLLHGVSMLSTYPVAAYLQRCPVMSSFGSYIPPAEASGSN
jgi:hypothetical protein